MKFSAVSLLDILLGPLSNVTATLYPQCHCMAFGHSGVNVQCGSQGIRHMAPVVNRSCMSNSPSTVLKTYLFLSSCPFCTIENNVDEQMDIVPKLLV